MSLEKPILFNGDMVRAILSGQKTQTRRIIKQQSGGIPYFLPNSNKGTFTFVSYESQQHALDWKQDGIICPYGCIGTILWVRETWRPALSDTHECYAYRADNMYRCGKKAPDDYYPTWKPSVYMPKKACRLFLRITDIRVERLQSISNEDAISEGIEPTLRSKYGYQVPKTYNYYHKPKSSMESCMGLRPIESFKSLWESINGEGSWDANPWVWVINFEKVNKDEFLERKI